MAWTALTGKQTQWHIDKKVILTIAGFFLILGLSFIDPSIGLAISLIIAALFVMVSLSSYLIQTGIQICIRFKIPLFLLGLIILPLLSSFHEQVIMILSSKETIFLPEYALAQQLSNKLFEMLITFGLLGSLFILRYQKDVEIMSNERLLVIRNGIIMFSGTILLALLVLFDGNLDLGDAMILILFYVMFIIIVYLTKSAGIQEINVEEIPDPSEINIIFELLKLVFILSMILLLGSWITENVVFLANQNAHFLRYSFFYMGILIALPNLVISIIGLYGDKPSLVIGLNIGSAIFELSISVALIAIFSPIYSLSTAIIYYLIIIVIVSALISIIYIRTQWRLKLWETVSLFVLYIAVIFIILYLNL